MLNLVRLLTTLMSRHVAIPISQLVISQWLEDFAYRAQLSWWMYSIPLRLIIVLAFLAIRFQSLKAAMTNPVKSSREQ